MSPPIPAVVLGGTGYVAGELLRLLAQHPRLELGAVLSDSQPGEQVAKAFPHLAVAYADTRFKSQAEIQALVAGAPECAVFSAAPHGVAAKLIDRAHELANSPECECDVDVSVEWVRPDDPVDPGAAPAHGRTAER